MLHTIVLIIDSDGPAYQSYARCRANWRKYMNLDPEIKCYFIRSNPNIQNDVVLDEENNTLYFKGTENYMPAILDNTLNAMDFCIKNFEFKYMIRTNLSSFYNFKTYREYVKTLPESNYISAVIGNTQYGNFPSGSGFILSKDVIKLAIEKNRTFVKRSEIHDDVCFGIFAKENNVSLIRGNRVDDFTRETNPNEISNKFQELKDKAYHYRVLYDRGSQDEYVKNFLIFQVYGV
jgi:hypothetical protein